MSGLDSEDLDETELHAMWQAYVVHDRTDRRLRDRLVQHYFPLVEQFVNSFSKRGGIWDKDNVRSWAMAGLLRAVENYDPVPRDGYEVPVSFGMYAYRAMSSESLDGLRREDFAPRSLRKRQRQIETAQAELTQDLGRTPTYEETANKLGESVQWLSMTMAEVKNSWIDPLEGSGAEESVESSDDTASVLRVALATEMQRLRPLEQALMALCHYHELTLTRAAAQIGISLPYASLIYQRAILQCYEAMLRSAGVV